MMQLCASAAKLRSGGPILNRGSKAMFGVGSPPPRIVICGRYAERDGPQKFLSWSPADSRLMSPGAGRCRPKFHQW
jgi:hypothetical protein